MYDCKHLQATQKNDDTFDHPSYHYFCKQKEKEILPCITCKLGRCNIYESTEAPFYTWFYAEDSCLPPLPLSKGNIVLHPISQEPCFQAENVKYHDYLYPLSKLTIFTSKKEAEDTFSEYQEK